MLSATSFSLTRSFNGAGTRVRALGTNLIRNDSGVIDPQWECFVDNVSIGSSAPFRYPENNWLFCPETPVQDGHHTLTIQTAVARNQTFWFDRIEYRPSPSLSLENQTIRVPYSDATIQYGNGWGNFGDFAKGTQRNGAVMTFNFYGMTLILSSILSWLESFPLGVSISWWGYNPGEFPGNSTTATWQIDDQPVQTFLIRGHSDGAGSSYNVKLFETPSYPYSSHRLTVIHKGNGQSTPLNLVSLLVQNGTLPSSGVAVPGASTTSKSTPTASIIGGAVAGAVVLVVAILLFVVFRRRRKAKKKLEVVDPIISESYLFHPISQIPPSTDTTDNATSAWGRRSDSRMASQSPPTTMTHRSNNRRVPVGSYGRDEVQSVEHSSDSMSLPYLRRDHSPRRPVKETEAESQAHGTFSDSYPPSNGPIPGPPRIVVHQDSGVRLQRPTEAPVIDIPPQYTPA